MMDSVALYASSTVGWVQCGGDPAGVQPLGDQEFLLQVAWAKHSGCRASSGPPEQAEDLFFR